MPRKLSERLEHHSENFEFQEHCLSDLLKEQAA